MYFSLYCCLYLTPHSTNTIFTQQTNEESATSSYSLYLKPHTRSNIFTNTKERATSSNCWYLPPHTRSNKISFHKRPTMIVPHHHHHQTRTTVSHKSIWNQHTKTTSSNDTTLFIHATTPSNNTTLFIHATHYASPLSIHHKIHQS